MTYFGNWKTFSEMRESFADYGPSTPVPADIDVLFASYDGGGYDGDAVVIFRKDGLLYEVHGGHCSCYGLEGQWAPEEATVESLKRTIPGRIEYHGTDAKTAFGALIAKLEEAR